VVLFFACSFDDALLMAEKEVQDYCRIDDPFANFCTEPMEWFEAYLIDDQPVDRLEVFSRLMDTKLSESSFIRRYYPKSHKHKPQVHLLQE
jgi:hypothetical protein